MALYVTLVLLACLTPTVFTLRSSAFDEDCPDKVGLNSKDDCLDINGESKIVPSNCCDELRWCNAEVLKISEAYASAVGQYYSICALQEKDVENSDGKFHIVDHTRICAPQCQEAPELQKNLMEYETVESKCTDEAGEIQMIKMRHNLIQALKEAVCTTTSTTSTITSVTEITVTTTTATSITSTTTTITSITTTMTTVTTTTTITTKTTTTTTSITTVTTTITTATTTTTKTTTTITSITTTMTTFTSTTTTTTKTTTTTTSITTFTNTITTTTTTSTTTTTMTTTTITATTTTTTTTTTTITTTTHTTITKTTTTQTTKTSVTETKTTVTKTTTKEDSSYIDFTQFYEVTGKNKKRVATFPGNKEYMCCCVKDEVRDSMSCELTKVPKLRMKCPKSGSQNWNSDKAGRKKICVVPRKDLPGHLSVLARTAELKERIAHILDKYVNGVDNHNPYNLEDVHVA